MILRNRHFPYKTHTPLTVGLIVSLALVVVCDTTSAQRSRIRARGPATEVGKNHQLVKTAYAKVTRDASRATVRIYDGQNQVALGTIVDSDGLVITKASCLSNNVSCRIHSGRRYDARVVATDEGHDIALLSISATQLPSIEFAEIRDLQLGSWLASPSGHANSLLALGVVSVRAREIPQDRAVLGIFIDDSEDGPKIMNVIPATAAERAGLRVDDVVLEVNDDRVDSHKSLVARLRQQRPGDQVKLKIQRGDRIRFITATMGRETEVFRGMDDSDDEVSGLLSDRRTGFEWAIQHDTLLQPYHCGGPVVDVDGQVVGINIARVSRVSSYLVPGGEARKVLEQLKSRVTRAAGLQPAT